MDRLEAMRVFVAVAEAQGFAAAARRLGMSPPAVTRAVSALEEHLGTRLLRRTTRIVRMTDAGARYLADCKCILGELEDAEAAAAGADAEPRGVLHVTASVNFGRVFVGPIVLDFLRQHPRVSARMLFVDHIVSLIDEGVDVAVRIAHLPDSGFRAIRVGGVRRVLCASPEYLARRGKPRKPADLAGHDTIAFSSISTARHWTFSRAGAVEPETVTPEPRIFVNTADAAIQAACDGHGVARVLSYMIQPELKSRSLELVLADFEPPEVPIHLVYTDGRHAAAKVRSFAEFAAERLRAHWARGAFGTKPAASPRPVRAGSIPATRRSPK
jgi:DNA-binding transcriptional LysR family regulator